MSDSIKFWWIKKRKLDEKIEFHCQKIGNELRFNKLLEKIIIKIVIKDGKVI